MIPDDPVLMSADMIETLTASMHQIPAHCRAGLFAYLTAGRPVGDFLMSVLSNDLRGAVNRADPQNIHALRAYVRLLNACAPPDAWGSQKAVELWLERGRRARLEAR